MLNKEMQLVKVAPPAYEKPMQAIRDFMEEERASADLALTDALKLVVKNDEQCKTAMESFVMARNRINSLEENRKSVTGPLNGLISTINDLFRAPSDKLKQARDLYNKKAVDYKCEEEAKREEEECKSREKAEAEEKRKRDEKERQEREWRNKGEAFMEEEKAFRKQGKKDEADVALKKANECFEKANMRAQQASEVYVAPKVTKATKAEAPKVAGFRAKSVKWYAKVINPIEVPMSYGGRRLWVIDEKALNDLATALKTADCPIPGVRFYSE
jgi:hypothetical protein